MIVLVSCFLHCAASCCAMFRTADNTLRTPQREKNWVCTLSQGCGEWKLKWFICRHFLPESYGMCWRSLYNISVRVLSLSSSYYLYHWRLIIVLSKNVVWLTSINYFFLFFIFYLFFLFNFYFLYFIPSIHHFILHSFFLYAFSKSYCFSHSFILSSVASCPYVFKVFVVILLIFASISVFVPFIF